MDPIALSVPRDTTGGDSVAKWGETDAGQDHRQERFRLARSPCRANHYARIKRPIRASRVVLKSGRRYGEFVGSRGMPDLFHSQRREWCIGRCY